MNNYFYLFPRFDRNQRSEEENSLKIELSIKWKEQSLSFHRHDIQ